MYHINLDGHKTLQVSRNNSGFLLHNKEVPTEVLKLRARTYQVFYKNKAHLVEVIGYDTASRSMRLKVNGKVAELTIKTDLDQLLEKLGMDQAGTSRIKELKAPMPGLILQINISEGQEVKKGDPVLILEAMKMENVIKAQGDGVVGQIHVKEKQSVEKNQTLIGFA